jgi:thiol:disulfide interchange protein
MGLPWPFAGAGLSFLPRPGRWMMIVKKLFGILILGFAFYYAHLAFTLSRVNPIDNAPGRVRESRKPLPEGWTANLRKGLETALDENRPVLIDFWASWCKNCLALDATTLRDPEVVRRLEPYVKIKFRAENPRAPETRAVLDRFEVLGLPTLLILEQE